MSHIQIPLWLRIGFTLGVVLLCVGIYYDTPHTVRGLSQWRWHVAQVHNNPALIRFAGILFGYLLLSTILVKHRQGFVHIAVAVLSTGIISYAGQSLHSRESPDIVIMRKTLSPKTNGYLQAAQGLRHWKRDLKRYNNIMSNGTIHVRTKPPGLYFLFGAFEKMTKDIPTLKRRVMKIIRRNWKTPPHWAVGVPATRLTAAWLAGMFLLLITSLVPLGIEWLMTSVGGRDVAHHPWAVLLWPLIPAVIQFTPQADILYALLACLAVAATLRGCSGQSAGYWCLGGLCVSIATFCSFGAGLVMLPLSLAVIWVLKKDYHRNKTILPAHLIFGIMLFSIALSLPWVVLYLFDGPSPVQLFKVAMAAHEKATLAVRSYIWWSLYNLFEFSLFLGPAVVLLWFVTLVKGNRLAWISLLSILVLTISGMSRGEVARLWLFMVPLVLSAFGELTVKRNSWLHLALLQVLVLFTMSSTWDVLWVGK